MTPSRLIKSIKFWNYLTTIINAKNASCLPTNILESKYKKENNSNLNLKLTRNSMPDLTIQDFTRLNRYS